MGGLMDGWVGRWVDEWTGEFKNANYLLPHKYKEYKSACRGNSINFLQITLHNEL
jgi:hypothetical protein